MAFTEAAMSIEINNLRKRQDFLTMVLTNTTAGVMERNLKDIKDNIPNMLFSTQVIVDTLPNVMAVALALPLDLVPNDTEDIIDFSQEFVYYAQGGEVKWPKYEALQEWFIEQRNS